MLRVYLGLLFYSIQSGEVAIPYIPPYSSIIFNPVLQYFQVNQHLAFQVEWDKSILCV